MDRDAASGFDRMVEELRQEISQQQEALYSDKVLREARAPDNVGRMEPADLHGAVHGWCGDTMEIYLRLDGRTIEKATFITDGCGPTVACGSMLTKMVTGATIERAEWILPEDLIQALDGLPEESVHCAGLAISTLQNALFNWRVSQVEGQEAAD